MSEPCFHRIIDSKISCRRNLLSKFKNLLSNFIIFDFILSTGSSYDQISSFVIKIIALIAGGWFILNFLNFLKNINLLV